jgi:hypothetical protein
MALPPGPRFAPLAAARLVRDPIGYLGRLQRRHGERLDPTPSVTGAPRIAAVLEGAPVRSA